MPARRLSLRLAVAGAALGTLAACNSTTDRYQGISLAADNVDEALRALAGRAAAGDKRAQLALGIRFETGDGVPVDLRRAERLYRLAATTTGDVRDVYFSSVHMKTPGKVLRTYEAPRFGVPEAQARLEALRERRRAAARQAPGEPGRH
jgi:TPR repeat protein